MSDGHQITASLVIIGNEILSGRTQDANLSFLAQGLGELGIRMMEARVIPDVEAVIADAVNELRAKHDYVFTTGGIGPTHDDITAQSIARAFGVDMIIHAEARALMEAHIGREKVTEAMLRLARVPMGATPVFNGVWWASGFQIENVFVMAGVPAIAQMMFEGVKDGLRRGTKWLTRTIECSLMESTFADELGDVQDRYPNLDIGSYPVWSAEGFKVSLVLRGTEPALLVRATEEVREMIKALGGLPEEGCVID